MACMDARLNVHGMLGLEEGDAHVIRNAGGVVTDDEIRSLAISQRLLGTEEIILIHHTDCGMLTFTDDEFTRSAPGGHRHQADWSPSRSPTSTRTCASRSAASGRARSSPNKDSIRGFVYDVETGRLREVDAGPVQSRFKREPAEERVTS